MSCICQINTVIPQRKVCGQLHESQTCAVAPRGDYPPAHGAGLYCETEVSSHPLHPHPSTI